MGVLKMLRGLVLFVFVFGIFGCAATQESQSPSTDQASSSEQPRIVSYLEPEYSGYVYRDYHVYEQGLGYSLRFDSKNESLNYADIYVWPAGEEAKGYSHKDLVLGATKASIDDIYSVQKAGHYSNVDIIDRAAYDNNGMILTVHKIVLLRNNLQSLSLLYITEADGKLLKARITLPDNEPNRNRTDTDQFVVQIFNLIVANIEDA